MIETVLGAVMLAAASALYTWCLPDDDWNPSSLIRIRWLSTLTPTLVICLGTAGILLIAQGVL